MSHTCITCHMSHGCLADISSTWCGLWLRLKEERHVGWMIMSWIVETDFETSKWRCLKRLVWLWGYLWLLIFNLLLCALLLNLLVCFFHVLIKCWYFPESILITLLHTIPTHLFSWLQQPAPLKTHRFLSLDIYPEFQLLSLTVLVVLIYILSRYLKISMSSFSLITFIV